MYLKVTSTHGSELIDIDDFLQSQAADDVNTLAPAFARRVLFKFRNDLVAGLDPMNIEFETYVTDASEDIEIDSSDSWVSQIRDILELVSWVNDKLTGRYCDDLSVNKVYAQLSDDWSGNIGGDYNYLVNNVTDVYDIGEEEEFARNWLDNTEGDLPEYLQPYFDYQAYGETLVNDRASIDWEGRTYLLDH